MEYFVFKKDNLTGVTTHICNGCYDTEDECLIHWRSYVYGLMDAMLEFRLQIGVMSSDQGTHKYSFRVYDRHTFCRMDVEYFMLLGQEGRDLVFKLANE